MQTHALVSFDGENANSVVPVKLIGYSKVGDKCDVVWPNDKKNYSGTVIALGIHYQLLCDIIDKQYQFAGTEQEMNSVLDDDIDDDDDNDGGVDSGGTDECKLSHRLKNTWIRNAEIIRNDPRFGT